MSSHKRIKGDYIIESIDTGDTITIGTGGITINGDLTVTGTANTVDTTNLAIVDNSIVLNSGEAGAGVTAVTAGIEIDRGTAADAGIRYNESTNIWEHDEGLGAGWLPFGAAGGTPGGIDTQLQYNNAGAFGGTPITYDGTDVTLVSNAGLVKLDQDLSFKEQGTDEVVAIGYNKVYAKTAAGGGTGLYVVNTANAGPEELISKSKAVVFSIIF